MTNKTTPNHVTTDIYDQIIIDESNASDVVITFKQDGNTKVIKHIVESGTTTTITKTVM